MQLKPDIWEDDTIKAAWWGGIRGLLIGIGLAALYFSLIR